MEQEQFVGFDVSQAETSVCVPGKGIRHRADGTVRSWRESGTRPSVPSQVRLDFDDRSSCRNKRPKGIEREQSNWDRSVRTVLDPARKAIN